MVGRGAMTVREAGCSGGSTTRRRHGPGLCKPTGRRGGEIAKQRHGPQFCGKAVRKGGPRVRQLAQAAKRARRGRQAVVGHLPGNGQPCRTTTNAHSAHLRSKVNSMLPAAGLAYLHPRDSHLVSPP
jgi:hypothetical protein